ncbi:MAG: oxygen-independent coproporphyrinogen III oxidase [Magnetococcales bacterium]|nr:oxygen-independent coproporphyrinogen III oxidase [Magnetococcales bacterium]NGZ26555.1 oxygen-independent coproporphyrinogen III oxidase [Magnetococcales bacterium]
MSNLSQEVTFDRQLLDRYNRAGPRYTSYPTAPHFHEGFGVKEFEEALVQSRLAQPPRPLSLYVHIPFCRMACSYCGCNRTVTQDRSRAVPYLARLYQEIAMVAQRVGGDRQVEQLHFGGGTPTFLAADQLSDLWATLDRHFSLKKDGSGEYGIEVDPREVTPEVIQLLGTLGFNRVSFGVQDLNPKVQEAVNRVQPAEMTERMVHAARGAGFQSVNIDLIYGLPHQSWSSFRTTLEESVERFDPDRLAVFNFAHLPQYFPNQRHIKAEDLPSAEEKMDILEGTIQTLLERGYIFIGMDHFAKPNDELAIAQRQGILHRNFQGYTTHGDCDLVAMGATAISQVGTVYAQSLRELEGYYDRIDSGQFATFRGYQLSQDDVIRQEVIMTMICNFRLDRKAIGERFNLDFAHYFAAEEPELAQMVADGLLTDDGNELRVTPAGRLLIRNICMPFDWYLRHADQIKTFSKTI